MIKTIGRTSPGPKIGKISSGEGHKKEIGTKGNTSGNQSSQGGQFSFLPSPESIMGSRANKDTSDKPGQVANTESQNKFAFMPKKAGGKK